MSAAIETNPPLNSILQGESLIELPAIDLESSKHLLTTMPMQRQRLAKANGANFTVLVTGESGTGKSTFIRTLFGNEYTKTKTGNHHGPFSLDTDKKLNLPTELQHQVKRMDIHRTADIEIRQVEVVENGFQTNLTVVDTPGFGDYTNNENTWVPIESYIDSQHRHYMLQEEQPIRMKLKDTRVHLCLYFLSPSNRVLDLDIAAMKSLSTRVNLVPVIGKGDSLTIEDRMEFKQLVRDVVEQHSITVWQPTQDSLPMDWPFAVATSDELVSNKDGELVRGREYRWGTVEINNPAHSDFSKLRDMLIGENMLSLIDDTNSRFYLPQRRALRLHRLGTALNLNNMNATTTKSMINRPSVSCMFPRESLKDAVPQASSAVEDAAKSMSSLEVLSIISKIDAKFLESERLSKDAVLLQRAQALTSQFDVVTKFQQERFAAQTQELMKKHDDMNHEVQMCTLANQKLEEEIKYMEAELKRRK